MDKNTLIALAAAFGIVTEGLKPKELQEALDASEGYKLYQEALEGKSKAETATADAEAKVILLESDLSAANQTIAQHLQEIDGLQLLYSQRGELLSAAQDKLDLLTAETGEDTRVLFESEDGNTYQVIPEKFRFKGTVFQSAEAVEKHRDVLEDLLKAKSFILKIV